MYQFHREFKTPPSDLIIWRYMDLWKFLDLLENQRLYLTRSDCFEDKLEGTFPINIIESNLSNKKFENIHYTTNKLRKNTFISSWTLNEEENFPMWKIYTDFRNAIAIKSTIGDLINSLNEDEGVQYIGKVKYYPKDEKSYQFRGNLFQMFLEKRHYFGFENELRIISTIDENQINESNEIPKGNFIKINCQELLKEIYIAPLADENFRSLVELKLTQLSFNMKINSSKI